MAAGAFRVAGEPIFLVPVERNGVADRADKLTAMMPSNLAVLNERQSVPSKLLGEPGPSAAELEALVDSALRVPDHGRLEPWRLVRVAGERRAQLGELLARLHRERDPDLNDAAMEKDRQRFNHAPVVIVVVACLTVPHKVPEIEQILSAGCVAYNLLIGAQTLGFGAQWLTGWAAYDGEVRRALGLADNERIVGFVHIGTAIERIADRQRPDAAARLSDWRG